MAKDKTSKFALREELAARFDKSVASIIAEYRGISAVELAELRVELRKVQTEFKVVKNRVAKKAISHEVPRLEPLSPKLVGPIGVAYLYGDVAAGTKTMLGFAKSHENFKVTGGIMEGRALSIEDLVAISELPSKEVLLARILGTLTAPHRGLMQVISGVPAKVVRVIAAIKDTKA